MLETLKNAWKMADLRAKLLYTGMILLLFRIGAAIPVPFLKPDILKTYISGDNNWLGYIDPVCSGDLPLHHCFHRDPAAGCGHSGPGTACEGG